MLRTLLALWALVSVNCLTLDVTIHANFPTLAACEAERVKHWNPSSACIVVETNDG